MWKSIQINEERHFFSVELKENTVVFCLLENLNKIWKEEIKTFDDFFIRAKNLNKRIDYDNDTIKETITEKDPVQVEFNSFSDSNVSKLWLKYKILNNPFIFEWQLELLSLEQFQDIITTPLFITLYVMSSRTKELLEIIKKKDIEIEQYKIEGAKLKRTTVTTQTFDEENFNKIFNHSNNFEEISKVIAEKKNCCNLSSISPSKSQSINNDALKLKKSPSQLKKRKLIEKRKKLESLLTSKKLEYELSQTPPNCNI